MANITVVNKKGEEVESLKLNEKVFDGKVNKALLQQAVAMYQANQRMGSANTKTRGEVRGGGKKPWKQKGTGRARVGSIRSPLWRGGGTTFGPITKNWHYQMPKKMKRLALLSSLNAKLNENNISVVDEFKLESHKTKELAAILSKMKMGKGRLFIISEQGAENLIKASRNISKTTSSKVEDINAYQVLLCDKILVEKEALKKLEKILAKAV
ncbi:MAG: 50S ribosomal protein L4 [Candidatus Omnitrophota bacterium]